MPWDNSRSGSNPKYATAEHRNRRAQLVKFIKAGRRVECCEDVCLMDQRRITNVDGRQPNGLNLAHFADGITYRGASHRKCNLYDAAVRARAKQDAATHAPRLIL